LTGRILVVSLVPVNPAEKIFSFRPTPGLSRRAVSGTEHCGEEGN
jgi:hypothetical protein